MQRESESSAGQRVEGRKANSFRDVTAEVYNKSPYKIRLFSLFYGTSFKSKIIGIRSKITMHQMVLLL